MDEPRAPSRRPTPEDELTPGEAMRAFLAVSTAIGREDGLRRIVATLRRIVGTPAAVVDLRGNLLESDPARFHWDLAALARWRAGEESVAGVSVAPVAAGSDIVALLCVASDRAPRQLLEFAASLIGLDLGRRQALLAGRRELAGQVLEDVLHATIAPREAARRLASFGVRFDRDNAVVVGDVDVARERLDSIPWNLSALVSEFDGPFLRATLGSRVVVVVPAGGAVESVARQTHEHLLRLARDATVGIGSGHPGVQGLRLSYLEACDALGNGPGVHQHRVLNLPRLLVQANVELGLEELAANVLAPLRAYDEQHGAQLVETLRAFFETDCSTAATAERLHVHRNTVGYRLALIESLTDRTLGDFATRAHFWLGLLIDEHARLRAGG